MTEAIVMQPRGELAVTSEQVAIARNTVAKGLNDDEFAVFLYNCQRQGIHPLDGLLIPISRNDNETGGKRLTFVTTVDLLRSRAAETNDYAGSEDPRFEYISGAQNPQSATVTVWKIVQGQRCEFTATARWVEYYPGDGKPGFMWRNKPHVMLGKCAEGLALRKAFPKQLAGLYLEEELQKEPIRRGGAPVPAQKKPVGDVMCNECRAVNGHLPSCPHRKENQKAPEPQTVQAEVVKEDAPKWLVQLGAVDKRSKDVKNKAGQVTGKQEYRIVTGINGNNENVTIYAWDTAHYPHLDSIQPKTNCVFEVERSKQGYFSLKNIIEPIPTQDDWDAPQTA